MQLQRKIGLPEGIALVTGGVIGMGIYVMIASIAEKSGPAVWLSIAAALLISVAGVVPLMQISSAVPVAGGGYFYCSRLLHPLAGTLVSYWAVLGGAASTCVVSVGLSDYLISVFNLSFSSLLLAGLIVIAFYILYQFGLKLVAWLQIIMSAQLVAALLIYVAGVGIQTKPAIGLSMPHGAGGFMMAVILSFNVCLGFQIITEMGEEMRDARKNIPLSLLLGGLAVLVIYVGIGVTYLGAAGERLAEYSDNKIVRAPLIASAKSFLPPWMIVFLGIGAVSAALTSLNAAAITIPRELYAQARDGILPRFFEKINPATNNPARAVTFFFLIVALLLLAGRFIEMKNIIDFYGYLAACGVMLLTIFVSIASLRLKKVFPKEYESAYFRVSAPWLIFFVVISVLSSLGLVMLLFLESKRIFLIYLFYTLVICIYYFFRRIRFRA
ncbi:MAG TPA: APC family permease [Chitinophagales bacterium]|nr:APC family permease [Chitinophagales bacterium]